MYVEKKFIAVTVACLRNNADVTVYAWKDDRMKSLDPIRAKKNIHKKKKMGQTVQFRVINPRQ